MKKLIFISTLFLIYNLMYAQYSKIPYFEEWIGNPNQYDDGVAYYTANGIYVKSVSIQGNKNEATFYHRENANQYKSVAKISPAANIDEFDNKYFILPLVQATYLRIEKKNEVKSIVLPEKAVYHAVSITEKHIFVLGSISNNAYFVCLDKEGTFKYDYTFNYPHYNQIKSIVEDKQENLYLAGYVEQSINNTFDAWLAKLSPDKEILWSKLYGTDQGTDEFYRVEFTPAGLLCSGLTYRNQSFDTYILHTDLEGNFGSIGNQPSYSYMRKNVLNVPANK